MPGLAGGIRIVPVTGDKNNRRAGLEPVSIESIFYDYSAKAIETIQQGQ